VPDQNTLQRTLADQFLCEEHFDSDAINVRGTNHGEKG